MDQTLKLVQELLTNGEFQKDVRLHFQWAAD